MHITNKIMVITSSLFVYILFLSTSAIQKNISDQNTLIPLRWECLILQIETTVQLKESRLFILYLIFPFTFLSVCIWTTSLAVPHAAGHGLTSLSCDSIAVILSFLSSLSHACVSVSLALSLLATPLFVDVITDQKIDTYTQLCVACLDLLESVCVCVCVTHI